MTRILTSAALMTVLASPVFAAGKDVGFVSLRNTDFVVLIAFILFIAVLFYFKVPGTIGGLLDKRAEGISSEIEEAKALQEEAKSLLADFERKHKDVQAQADRIVAQAKEDAERASDKAKDDLKASIARRLTAAEEQIAAAEGAAVKEVRDTAISVAVSVAQDVMAKQMTAADGNQLIDDGIAMVDTKLH